VDRYIVLARIWHTGDECYYNAGDNVTMTHLAEFQIERLMAQGIIEPVEPVKKVKAKVKAKSQPRP